MSHKLNGDDQTGNEMKHNHHRRHRSDIDRYFEYMINIYLHLHHHVLLSFCNRILLERKSKLSTTSVEFLSSQISEPLFERFQTK